MSTSPYPVHVGAELDTGLTRWLWLVKWPGGAAGEQLRVRLS